MIVFDLECQSGGHRFEGWFGSSTDFERQQERGLVSCPHCGSADIIKAPMAPHLARKGNQQSATSQPAAPVPTVAVPMAKAPMSVATAPKAAIPPEVQAAMITFAQAQAEALKQSRWVGGKFADDARAMHYGDKPVELIHGQATPKEAQALMEEGIAVAPILFPVAPPDEIN